MDPAADDGEGKDRGLWRRMVTEDFLIVAVQAVWPVSGRIAPIAGIGRDMAHHVVSRLACRPPLGTGEAPDPAAAACMARLAPYQLPRLGRPRYRAAGDLLPRRVGSGPRLFVDMAAIVPMAAWHARPALIGRAR